VPIIKKHSPGPVLPSVEEVLASLKQCATTAMLDGMARYGLPNDHALGVTMANLKILAKKLGRNHDLAAGLWATGWYEARMLASMIDEPARVTATQMERWCGDFDNWGICDTVCFHLFDRTPFAWTKVEKWSSRRDEFGKRAAFALLWSLTVHDKKAEDDKYVHGLMLIEREAHDERHFVKKAVNMALRAVGKRNFALNTAAIEVARRQSESADPTKRWVGKDALRELASPALAKRLAKRR